MDFGSQVLAWRQKLGLTQEELAAKTGLARLSISKIERGEVDPVLSTIRKLAVAFGVTIGTLIEKKVLFAQLTRQQLDKLAGAALQPSGKDARNLQDARRLSRLLIHKRYALGLYVPRKAGLAGGEHVGVHSVRWLKAKFGEKQWKALLSRIDKRASVLIASYRKG